MNIQEFFFRHCIRAAPWEDIFCKGLNREQTVSFLEATVIDSIEVETHTIFIGKVINAEVLSDSELLTYAYYQQIKRGTVPRSAPIQAIEEKTVTSISKGKVDNKMKKYQCAVCGYVYDPTLGDPDSGIAPGTAFEDIPDD